MAFLELPSHRLHYRVDGDRGPWLVFSNSLGTDLHMWDAQAGALSDSFRVLRYDRRGHGRSTAPPAPYALSDLGGDVLRLLDALEIERAHFCGLSIGGLVGQWLGVHAGDRLDRLAVCSTAPKIGTAESWAARRDQVRADGLSPLVEATIERWFTPDFNANHAGVVNRVLDGFTATSVEGYCGCCDALAGADLRAALGRITVPVLAISGDDDPVCTPDDLQGIADAVPDGRHVSLPGRHIVNVESPGGFNAALAEFLG